MGNSVPDGQDQRHRARCRVEVIGHWDPGAGRGAKEPVTDPVDGGFTIRNAVTEVAGENTTKISSATTSAIASRLARYALPKKEIALIHITRVGPKTSELAVADMWKLPVGCDITPFQTELAATQEILKNNAHGIKRKRDAHDESLQGLWAKKRIHKTIGDKAVES